MSPRWNPYFHLVLAASACAAGCAPSLSSLIEHREYGEAVCAVTKFGDDPRDQARVRAALAKDADPLLHVHAVSHDELRRALGPSADRILDDYVLLRVIVQTHRVSLGRFVSEVALEAGGQPVRKVGSQREALAVLTGEHLPGSRVYVSKASFLDRVDATLQGPGGFAAGAGEALTLGTIPFLEIFGLVQRTTHRREEPTAEDYERQSPKTEALHRAGLSIWERPATRDVSLVVRWSYTNHSYRGTCQLPDEVRISLPPGPTLESRVNALFGSRMHRFESFRKTSP